MALSSIEPETSIFDVGENAIDSIGAVWPSYTWRGRGGVDDEGKVPRGGLS